ncbi:Centrosomin [Frankliniella fusca]|uniref:Centrosomin n=1 Tax=Frankliniella fusca TaxID=407009 RepID=A0AAE1GWQ3_9NEOP|nr:Centrosomin [Frankliniella fusca]
MEETLPQSTSPSQLHEALGETFSEAFFNKPTTSKASPLRGRTMREVEEKQSQLKKENFNLKLRIYFLEERMGQIAGLKDKEEAIKKNIELQVENESMRKELSEKQDLLCQASKALDLMEEQRKEEKLRLTKDCAALEVRVQELEKELQESAQLAAQQMKFSAMTQSTDSQYSSACFEVDQLTAQLQEAQEQGKEDKEKIRKLEAELNTSRQEIESLRTTINTQTSVLQKLEDSVGVAQSDLINSVQKLLDETSELRAQIKAHEETVAEKDSKHQKLKKIAASLKEEVQNLKRQRQEDLKRKLSDCANCSDVVAQKKVILEKYQEKCNEILNQKEVLEKNALITRTIMSDYSKLKEELKAKEEVISDLKNKLKREDKSDDSKPSDEECRLQSIQASLKEKESQLVACEQRLEARDNRIQELEHEIQSLKKECEIITTRNNINSEVTCNNESHENISKQLIDKEKEIENLNMELRKRTFNLQELVNKELWDKNKQIERLELRLAAQGAVCDRKELDLKEARRKLAEFGVTVTSLSQLGADVTSDDVSELQEQLKISLEEQMYLSREVDSLKERLRNTPERDSESARLQRLLEENKKLKMSEIYSKLWRREASKALSVLRTRLEELAVFLDELLHQPALLVGLGAERQQVLRAAINGSLELSRTIANLSNDSTPDDNCSHSQCTGTNISLCNISLEDPEYSEILELDLKPDSLKFDKTIITVDESSITQRSMQSLKQINQALDATCNNESKVSQTSCLAPNRARRRSRSHPQSNIQKDVAANYNAGSQSDSESWSEPDRSVSQARMGIHNESSRTLSSVASTVRRVSLGGQSSSSSCGSKHQIKPNKRSSVKENTNVEHHLVARTQCLEKLNQAVENELHAGGAPTSPSHLQLESKNCENSAFESAMGSSNLLKRLDWERNARKAWQQCAEHRLHQLQVLSKANGTLSEKVVQQERLQKERHTEFLDMKFALAEMNQSPDERQNVSSQVLRGLEEKVQELSVQVLEVEVRREQAEQDAQQALEEKNQLQRDLGSKLAAAEKELEQSRREATALQASVKQLLNKKFELEKVAKSWKEKVEDLEREVEKWKRAAQTYELEVKEVHSQLSHKFKEKLFLLEKLKNNAEQRAEEWLNKYNEAEAKYAEIDRRAKEKIRLMEEQLKLKQAEIERRSEELQEKLKRDAEIRASRKLEKIVEQRMAEYDLESRASNSKQMRDMENAYLSRINDLEKRIASAASDSKRQNPDVEEKIKVEEKLPMDNKGNAEGDDDVQRQLNEAAVAVSQAQLETARLANEKLQLEQQVRWLQGEAMRERRQLHDQLSRKIQSLTQANTDLQKQVRDLERGVHANQYARRKESISHCSSSGSEGKVLSEITNLKHCNTNASDYVSEQEDGVHPEASDHPWYREAPLSPPAVLLTTDSNTVSVRNGRVTTASPDLGIESDQGRFSSLEPFPIKKSTTAPALNSGESFPGNFQVKKKNQLDYKGLEQENQELKQRLLHTRQTLEQTYAQLAAANQRKRLVEKAICKQLHKTHHILRRARDNFETNASTTPQPDEDSLQCTDSV